MLSEVSKSWEPKAQIVLSEISTNHHYPSSEMPDGQNRDEGPNTSPSFNLKGASGNDWRSVIPWNCTQQPGKMHFISSYHQRHLEYCNPQDSRSWARTLANASSWVGTAVGGCFHWWYLSLRIIQTCVTSKRNHSGKIVHTTGLQLSSWKSRFKSSCLSRYAMTQL